MKNRYKMPHSDKGAFNMREWRENFLEKEERKKFYYERKAGVYPLCFWFRNTQRKIKPRILSYVTTSYS